MTRLNGLWVAMFVVGCGSGDATPDAFPIDAEPPGGTLSLSWNITDGNNALACGDVAALTVRVTATPTGGGASVPNPLTCSSGTGATAPIPAGRYNVVATLTASAGTLATVPLGTFDIASNVETPLPDVTFTVTTNGGLLLRINSNAPGTNCGTTNQDAGITGTLLELLDSNGQCMATTFEIGIGANNTAFSYATTCMAGPESTCIENDQDISITSLPSGDYSVRIVGAETTFPCYQASVAFAVPGGDLIADLGTRSIPLDTNNTNCVYP